MPISLRAWADEISEMVAENPAEGILRAGYYTYLGLWHTVTSRHQFGRNVFAYDWDALIVLDACRVDALRTVAPEHPWLPGEAIESVWSLGSGSHEWLGRTFTEAYRDTIANTAFTTPNGFAKIAFSEQMYPPHHPAPFGAVKNRPVQTDDFDLLDFAWGTGWDADVDTVPPRVMTDRGIHIGRKYDADRLIVHYYQPHKPYLAGALEESRPPTEAEATPFQQLRSGSLSHATAWSMYLDNIRHVLNETALLLENLDAETVVITADHGELFGEWGLYQHPEGVPHPALRKVPWVVVSATESSTHCPAQEHIQPIGIETGRETEVRRDRLEPLGYL